METEPAPESTPSVNASPDSINLKASDILENVADAFITLDRDWRIIYANREACRINQKPREQFVGRVHWDEWPAAVGTELERQFRRVMDERTAAHFEHRYVLDPYDVWLEIDAYPAENGINLFYRDITARKQAEEGMRQFQFIADNANDAFFLLDGAGRFVYVNAAACRSLGYTAEQFQSLRPLDIDPFYDAAQYQALFQRLDGERLPPFESLHRRVDGSTFPIEASVSRVDIGGRRLLFSSCRDITERKRAEEENLRLLERDRDSARRQKVFLKDVLRSVSEGKLRLVDDASELPARLPQVGRPVRLDTTEKLRVFRQLAQRVAERLGFDDLRWQHLVTAVSEAAMNAVVHAGGGFGYVCASAEMVQVWVEDTGKGIAYDILPRATLEKGWSSGSSLGHGFWLMLNTVDRVWLKTSEAGTVVVIEQQRTEPLPDWLSEFHV